MRSVAIAILVSFLGIGCGQARDVSGVKVASGGGGDASLVGDVDVSPSLVSTGDKAAGGASIDKSKSFSFSFGDGLDNQYLISLAVLLGGYPPLRMLRKRLFGDPGAELAARVDALVKEIAELKAQRGGF